MSTTVILIILLAACVLMHLVGHGHGSHRAGHGRHEGCRHAPDTEDRDEPEREPAQPTRHHHH